MALNSRYANKMTPEFSDQNILNAWRDIEHAVLEARMEMAHADGDDAKCAEFFAAATALSRIGDVNVKRKEEIEKETKHDLVAAIRAMGEQVDAMNPGKNYGRLIHQGITSYDTEDPAQSLMLARAGTKMLKRMEELRDALLKKANLFKYAPCNGFTHNQVAEPITIGKRFLDAVVGIDEQIKAFAAEIEKINVCKIRGAVGIYSGSLTPKFEALVAAKLGQKPARIGTQILPIQNLIPFFTPFLTAACTCENLAQNLRLASGDLAEVREGFAKDQTGSSTMTYKQNPINLENITGATRAVKAKMNELMHATVSWDERDISNSFQVQRHIIPDLFELLEHIVSKTLAVLDGLNVYPIQAMRNVNKYGDVLYSAAVKEYFSTKFATADNKDVYDMVQPASIAAKNAATWRGETVSLFEQLAPDVEKIGGADAVSELQTIMSLPYNLRNVNECYSVAGYGTTVAEDNSHTTPESVIHSDLVDYMINSGQLAEFKKSDSLAFIDAYAAVANANYPGERWFAVRRNLELVVDRFKSALAK
ncbi:MAG: lyase family protein [Proteobacteria bacterium]|nr:lyase family protein [Pseudomonadota bacterium]